MTDNGNNSNQDDPLGQGHQNSSSYLNRQSSFNPNSSDMSYGNNYSSYNRLPSSYSSMNDSYGGYSSGYGGYGGSTGYGGYSGGYGGYNRGYGGYSSYGNSSYTNQYSNHYSKPLPPDQQNQQQNQQNQQIPPPNFRQDMWGFLNGFHAMLNVLYAATGIVHFGKIFMRMSIKIIKMVCGKSIGLVFKLTGFKFLKKILMGLSTTDNWSSEFNFSEQPFENAWRTDDRVNNSTIFGKIMLVLRICSLLGTGLALFLRSKMRHQHPPVQAETLGPDVPSLEAPQMNATDFERVKSFYEDIRVIEDDNNFENQQNLASVLNATLEQGMQEAETFVQVLEEDDKSVTEKLSPEEEPIKVVDETSPENSSEVVESQSTTAEKEETAVKEVDTVTAADSINTKEEITFPIIEKIEHTFSAAPIMQTETVKVDTVSNQDTPVTKDSISSTPQEAIVSEDFWKNQEVYKSIENIQKEEQKPEKKEFELPSVLKTLRSSSTPANKPWLMKKKKTVEVPDETPQQAQTSPVENLAKVPEVQETPEVVVKAEKVTETPDVTPDMNVETQLMENLEGTTV